MQQKMSPRKDHFSHKLGKTNKAKIAQQKDTAAYKKYMPELLMKLEIFVENLVTCYRVIQLHFSELNGVIS